jgi:GNAT superfamily N-acetyltransferase
VHIPAARRYATLSHVTRDVLYAERRDESLHATPTALPAHGASMPLTDVTIHYLELSLERFVPKRSGETGVTFSRVDPPMPELNRFLYMTIGAPWFWVERRGWTLAQWNAHVMRPGALETWLFAVDGVPAGYAELEPRPENAVEIVYIGLHGNFIGRGLGAHLLTCAVESAFAMDAKKVLLETCNFDHPHALANYFARGFRETHVVVKRKEIPRVPPDAGEYRTAGSVE